MPKNVGGWEQKKHKESCPTKTVGQDDSPPPTYSEINITYKNAARWKKAAEHEVEIAQKVIKTKAKGQPVTANRVINQVLQER